MAIYEVRKGSRDVRGVSIPRYDLYVGERYITGIDVPAAADMDWYRVAARRVRANLLARNEDADPTFGVSGEHLEARTFAEMLNA